MKTTSIETVTKMMETLPEVAQSMVVKQVRDFIADIEDESKWDQLFKEREDKLIEMARKAKQEILKGRSKPMDYDRL